MQVSITLPDLVVIAPVFLLADIPGETKMADKLTIPPSVLKLYSLHLLVCDFYRLISLPKRRSE